MIGSGISFTNPMGEFGNKFRQAREKKNLSLDDVSKISSRMLKAIEEEHFDQLPGGVFNKGFIRAYAKHLGLNSEEAVTDYLACLRQAQIDANEVWEPVRPATRPLPRPPPAANRSQRRLGPFSPPPPPPPNACSSRETPRLYQARDEDSGAH